MIKNPLFKSILLFVLCFITAAAVACGAYVSQQRIQLPPGLSGVSVNIERGQTLSALALKWQNQGWLPSARFLLLQAKLLGLSTKIKSGEFDIPANTKILDVLPLLVKGKGIRHKVSLIEGMRVKEALALLGATSRLEQDVQPLDESSVRSLLNIQTPLEGLLYPDTYVYHRGDSVSSLIKQAHQRMQEVLQQEWDGYQQALVAGTRSALPYHSPYDALIMASIIEKETGQASERPQISGVFVRRLEKNMRLETDPTVIYGLFDQYQGNLRKKHLRDRSNLYNTYRHKGLPPTPIAMAGRAAVRAALNPASGDALYFVAKGDGSHYFSSNLKQHNRAVRNYQLKRRKDYRTSPEKH